MMGSLVPVSLFFVLSSPLFSFSRAITIDLETAPTLSFEEGYTQTFGNGNLMLLRNGRTVRVALDERTGAGFASQDLYLHGFFSASIKLPPDYAAGVVVAFYMSNGDLYEKTHDELDFEFLGNIRGREWRVQTNVYSNGSTGAGREERYDLWFDPTENFHRYSILWSQDRVIFYIDKIPVREIERNKSMRGAFPSKPMSLYATIWDGSSWATSGGRYKVNYNYAPYVAEFTNLILHGCAVNPFDHSSSCNERDAARYNSGTISPEERAKMESFRQNYMTYSYCYDRDRYVTPPQDCSLDHSEISHSYGYDSVRFGSHHSHHGRRHRHRTSPSSADAAL